MNLYYEVIIEPNVNSDLPGLQKDFNAIFDQVFTDEQCLEFINGIDGLSLIFGIDKKAGRLEALNIFIARAEKIKAEQKIHNATKTTHDSRDLPEPPPPPPTRQITDGVKIHNPTGKKKGWFSRR